MNTSDTTRVEDSSAELRITAHRIDDDQRLGTLPRFFGDRMMHFESAVFGWMHRIAPDYRGAFWQFYELDNNGFYMAPDRGTYGILIDTNGYQGIMSADAAGITTCLFACSHLSFNDPKGELFAERFHQLRDYAAGHPESGDIFSAID